MSSHGRARPVHRHASRAAPWRLPRRFRRALASYTWGRVSIGIIFTRMRMRTYVPGLHAPARGRGPRGAGARRAVSRRPPSAPSRAHVPAAAAPRMHADAVRDRSRTRHCCGQRALSIGIALRTTVHTLAAVTTVCTVLIVCLCVFYLM